MLLLVSQPQQEMQVVQYMLFLLGILVQVWKLIIALPPPKGPSPALTPKRRNMFKLAMGFGFGGLIFVGGLVAILFALWKRSRRDVLDEELDEEFQMGTGTKRFSYDELARATNSFNDKEKLGQGGFGGVYRGYLRDLKLHCCY